MPGLRYPFVAQLLHDVTTDAMRTLDVGCGGRQYHDAVQGCYVGLDVPTSAYLSGTGPELFARAEQLPLQTGSVDVVFTVATFSLVPDVAAALAECRRVLRDDGRLLLVDYQRPVGERIRREHPDLHHHVWSYADLAALLVAAGFGSVRDRSVEGRRRAGGPLLPHLTARARRILRGDLWLVAEARR